MVSAFFGLCVSVVADFVYYTIYLVTKVLGKVHEIPSLVNFNIAAEDRFQFINSSQFSTI